MKTKPSDTKRLAGEIEATEAKLRDLEEEIEEIGEPASCALESRLKALRIEEHALQRNFAELQPPRTHDAVRLRKVLALLHHIEREETSLEHEADFLHQASPTTLELAFKGAARILDPAVRGLKKAKGGHQLLWHSPFVNSTFKSLSARFDLPRPKR